MVAKGPPRRGTQYLLAGITEGFQIGYDYSRTCVSAKCNLSSAEENPGVVTAYLLEEVDLGKVIGTVPKEITYEIYISHVASWASGD